MANNHDRDHVIKEGNRHILGTIRRMYIGKTVAGAETRRAGPEGVKFWKEQFQDVGFNTSNEAGHFIRIYPNDEDLDKWIAAFAGAKAGYTKAGVALPLTGPELDEDPPELKSKTKNTLDGGHRSTALTQLFAESEDDNREDMYMYVQGIVYHSDVKYGAALLGNTNTSIRIDVFFFLHQCTECDRISQ